MRAVVFSLATLIAALAGAPAMAVEEPPFRLVARERGFEVREYPALTVAEVTVEGTRSQAANRGFRPLAGYIFGGNRPRAKIAMTAPVLTEPASRDGQKIAMTAPVLQSPLDADSWIVRFVMPQGYTVANLPDPDDPRVRLVETPARRVAVARFTGLWDEAGLARKSAQLDAQIREAGLTPAGPPSFAFYDPPWTPPFLRRNEIMTPIAP